MSRILVWLYAVALHARFAFSSQTSTDLQQPFLEHSCHDPTNSSFAVEDSLVDSPPEEEHAGVMLLQERLVPLPQSMVQGTGSIATDPSQQEPSFQFRYKPGDSVFKDLLKNQFDIMSKITQASQEMRLPNPYAATGDVHKAQSELNGLMTWRALWSPEVFRQFTDNLTSFAFSFRMTACCCTRGPCGASAVGARGLKARTHKFAESHIDIFESQATLSNSDIPITLQDDRPDLDAQMCCTEVYNQCEAKEQLYSYKYCVPEEQSNNARTCRSGQSNTVWWQAHHWLSTGDEGCDRYLLQNGGFAHRGKKIDYQRLDCPFPESTELSQARRALLRSYIRKRPASTADIFHSCGGLVNGTGTNVSQRVLNISGDLWSKTLQPVKEYLASYKPDVKEFVCSTLRFAPVMLSQIGFRADIGLRDETMPDNFDYPRSFRGQMVGEPFSFRAMTCTIYYEFTKEETRLARRVLRAVAPTYAVYQLPSDMVKGYERIKLGGLMGPNFWEPLDFKTQVERGCHPRTSDESLAQLPISRLQNSNALKRDTITCTQGFPCAFYDKSCSANDDIFKSETCRCNCQAAMCNAFLEDFYQSLRLASKLESCVAILNGSHISD